MPSGLTHIHPPPALRFGGPVAVRFGLVCVLSTVSGTDQSRRSADREIYVHVYISINHPPPSLLCEPVAGEVDEQERVLVEAQPVDVERPRAPCECVCIGHSINRRHTRPTRPVPPVKFTTASRAPMHDMTSLITRRLAGAHEPGAAPPRGVLQQRAHQAGLAHVGAPQEGHLFLFFVEGILWVLAWVVGVSAASQRTPPQPTPSHIHPPHTSVCRGEATWGRA